MLEVYTLNTTEWRKYIGNLAKDEDKKFSWFLCGKKIYDERMRAYILEVPFGSLFYNKSTGETYVNKPPKTSDGKEKTDVPVKLLIANRHPDSATQKFLKREGLQGFTYELQCKSTPQGLVCDEAVFYFLPGILSLSVKEENCELILYAKMHNDCIRSILPIFPTIKEIDKVLETYPCTTVCRVLYDYLEQSSWGAKN